MRLERLIKQLQIDLQLEDVSEELARGKTMCEHFFPEFETYPQWLKEVLINAALVPWTPIFVMAIYDKNFEMAADALGCDEPRTLRLASRLQNKC